MKETLDDMKQKMDRIAAKLTQANHPRSAELTRIAQYFGDMSALAGSTNLADGGYGASVQTMSGAGDAGETSKENLNPGISSYVKMRPGEEPMVDDRKTHTCTVIFKAPDGVSESDMMNYILGIGQELGVDVESFKWSKAEVKQMKPSV